MTTFHACLDIHHGVIRHARTPRNLDGILKDAATGKPMTGEQVLAHAIDLAEQGFKAIPVGCDNHDGKGRCLGHADANNVATTEVPEPSVAIVYHLDKLAWLLAEGVLILKDRNPDDAEWFAQAEAALDAIHKQGITSILPLENDAAVEAIQFALNNDDGIDFLRCWNEGDFQAIRDEWPEAPEEVFIGADPLHRKEPERAPAQQGARYMHASGNLNAVHDTDGDRRYLVLETSANPAEHYQSTGPILAHCPFCGQLDALVEQLDSDASVVVCQGRISEHSACLARGPVGVQQDDCEDQPGYDKAVEEWNRRAAEQHQSNMVSTKFLLVSHPNGHAWVVQVGDKHHRAALRTSHLSIATLCTTTAPRTAIVNKLDIALAEFLRGKMKRLHASYSLAFEAGWHAHNPSEIELCYEHALKSIEAEADRLRSEVNTMHKDAERYRWLRSRDLNTIHDGGVFAGLTPANLIVNNDDLDKAVDAEIAQAVKP